MLIRDDQNFEKLGKSSIACCKTVNIFQDLKYIWGIEKTLRLFLSDQRGFVVNLLIILYKIRGLLAAQMDIVKELYLLN